MEYALSAMDRARFKHHFTGPLASINTPFGSDGAIDYDGLRRFVDAAIAGGARTVLFTPGDSLYAVLSEQEIADLTRATREHVGSRAMFLAAAGPWWQDQAVAFARHAAEIGADGVLASPPYRGVTVRDCADYFLAVSRELPTVILSATLAPLGLGGALEAVRLLLAEGDRIVGFKEDYGPEFARPACLLSQGTWSNFAGGQKQTHMDMHPYGCDGFMSVLVVFKPEITRAYWNAIERGDLAAATSVIRDYDMPMFDLMGASPAGSDAAQHAMMELAGISGRWRRAPLSDYTDEELERLRAGLQELSLL